MSHENIVDQFNHVAFKSAAQMVNMCLDARIVPLVKGSPGMGKSALAAFIAKTRNLFLIDLRLAQCDVTDLIGFPFMDHSTKLASYYPLDTFPITSTPLPLKADGTQYSGWLLMLDELTSARQDIQAASYKLILDRMVGNHRLHDKVFVMAAGNLETDNAIVEPMSTALTSRMAHIYMRVDKADFESWAYSEGDIDSRIMAFLGWKPNFLYNFKPESTYDTYACPRTWEFVSRIIKAAGKIDANTRNLVCGLIGKAVGTEFCSFVKIVDELPNLDLVFTNPHGAPLPDMGRPDMQYATVTALSQRCNASNMDQAIHYIRRLPQEMQMIMVKMTLLNKTNEEKLAISQSEVFREWRNQMSKVVHG